MAQAAPHKTCAYHPLFLRGETVFFADFSRTPRARNNSNVSWGTFRKPRGVFRRGGFRPWRKSNVPVLPIELRSRQKREQKSAQAAGRVRPKKSKQQLPYMKGRNNYSAVGQRLLWTREREQKHLVFFWGFLDVAGLSQAPRVLTFVFFSVRSCAPLSCRLTHISASIRAISAFGGHTGIALRFVHARRQCATEGHRQALATIEPHVLATPQRMKPIRITPRPLSSRDSSYTLLPALSPYSYTLSTFCHVAHTPK